MPSPPKMCLQLPLRLLPLLVLASCQFIFPPRENGPETLNKLLQTDADFSTMVRDKGYRKAFLAYLEDDAVLLRNHYLPFVGADAVKYLTGLDETSFSMTWDPQGGYVAESGDLGYTWGVYTITTSSGTQKGNYVTVWRRQKDGHWKVVLDANTQGSEPMNAAPSGQ
jgi:ketosteroid isomerase-like protein